MKTYKGVEYAPKNVDGVMIELTDAECEAQLQKTIAWNNNSVNRKLAEIKAIRNEKLQATDYMANSDYTLPDNIKTWRQSLRDIPQNNTTEEEYDLLLARVDGQLTHEIWSKP